MIARKQISAEELFSLPSFEIMGLRKSLALWESETLVIWAFAIDKNDKQEFDGGRYYVEQII